MLTLLEIGKILGVKTPSNLPIQSYTIDSRQVDKGSLFFALKGEKDDGHDYLESVAEKGGYGAVVSSTYQGPSYGLVLIRVEDALQALQFLAKSVLERRKTKVIGITGSVGKTTIKEFLYEVLSVKFSVVKNPRSYNSQRTLPLVILNATGNEEYLILEMAMSEKGNIANLVTIAPPKFVILNRIGLVHAEFFDTLDDIARAKAEILAPSVEFAVIHTAAISLKPVQEALCCEHTVFPTKVPFDIPLKETHFQENFSGVYEMAKHLGMQDSEIQKGVSKLKAVKNRFEVKLWQGITFIDASYNANPISATAVLQNLPKPKQDGKRIAVFGSMKELGKYSEMSHREVARVALEFIDHLLLIGKESAPMVQVFQKAGKPVEIFERQDLLANRMREISKKGDVVLVKGSNSHELWKVIAFIE